MNVASGKGTRQIRGMDDPEKMENGSHGKTAEAVDKARGCMKEES